MATMLNASTYGAVGDGVTDDTTALQNALNDMRTMAVGGGATYLTINPGTYKVSSTLNVNFSAVASSGGSGIIAYGAALASYITNNTPLLLIQATNGGLVRNFTIQGLALRGRRTSGTDGQGLVVKAPTGSEFFYNMCLRDVSIEQFTREGCQLAGDVFESQIFNSYFRGNNHGLSLANIGGGSSNGILSSIHIFGCVFGDNTVHGVRTDAIGTGVAEPYDIGFHGCYFLLNGQHGAYMNQGFSTMVNCGFENNWNTATRQSTNYQLWFQNVGSMLGCSGGGNNGKSAYLVGGYVTSTFAMVGCSGNDTSPDFCKLSFLNGVNGTSKVTQIACRFGRDINPSNPTYASDVTAIGCI